MDARLIYLVVFAVLFVIASGQLPILDSSTLILLGIGSVTTAVARLMDISDTQNYNAAIAAATGTNATTGTTAPVVVTSNTAVGTPAALSKDMPSQGFLLDILSDKTGVSIHRLQAVMFNLVFGVWFMFQSVKH